MKKTILILSVLAVIVLMVSSATALPTVNSMPVMEKINQIEKLNNNLTVIKTAGALGLFGLLKLILWIINLFKKIAILKNIIIFIVEILGKIC